MSSLKVGYQGEQGSYSEEAVKRFVRDAKPVPFRYFSAVFEAVALADIDQGVVPVENSQAGSINDTYDLLLQYDLNIVGEIHLRVRHCLLALEGDSLDTIETIYSHPQALAQCEAFLSSLKATLIPTYDTAGSAKMIKEKNLKQSAAIASKRVSDIYDLELLAEGIETNPQNFTRFFVISREKAGYDPKAKTSLVFRIKNIPGSLYDSLGAFATRSINLTKLESRPAKDTPWDYVFYVDFEGHSEDANCREAMSELASRCNFVKLLGSYPHLLPNEPN